MQFFKHFLVVALVIISLQGRSQQLVQDSIARERISLNRTHMLILGAWAGANIIQGSISASNATGSGHYFHQFNAYWNIANLTLAGVNLLMIKKQQAKQYTYADNLHAQHQLEKILLFNTGLDVAYIATGLYLKERGQRLNNDQPIGYGNSLLLQGGFLLLFDIIQYSAHHRNTIWLENNPGSWQVGAAGAGLGLSYHFK